MRGVKEGGRREPGAYGWIDEPMETMEISGIEEEVVDHLYDYRRMPLAFLYEGGKLRHVEPNSTMVASPRKWVNIYRAHMLIYLEDDGGRRSVYVEACKLPYAMCEAAEDAAARVWREGGAVGDVVEAVESLAVV